MKFYFALIIIFISALSYGQCPPNNYVFDTQQKIDDFPIDYPSCTSLSLIIRGDDVVDLTPLQDVSSVKTFSVSNTTLLQNLDGLNFTTFTGEGGFSLYNNLALENIDALSNVTGSVYGSLSFVNNTLLESLMPLSNVTFISSDESGIFIYDNNSLIDFRGLENFDGHTFDAYIYNNESLISFEGLDTITLGTYCCGSDATVIIRDNPSLVTIENVTISVEGTGSITIDNNQSLTTLSLFGTEFQSCATLLYIRNNPNLTTCDSEFICNYIANGVAQGSPCGRLNIYDNAEGCDNSTQVADACGISYNLIKGNVKVDFGNGAGCETNLEGTTVSARRNGVARRRSNTNSVGDYYILAPATGNFDVTVESIIGLPSGFTTTPDEHLFTFNDFGNEVVADFCVEALETDEELYITLFSPLGPPRPGLSSSYRIVYANYTEDIYNDIVTLEFDDSRQTFLNATPAPTSVLGNLITWDYTDLTFGFPQEIFVLFDHFEPPINELGDTLQMTATIAPGGIESVLEQVYVDSYDPNDKAVMQGEGIYMEQVGDFLDYVIRFQNLGTADALDVRVEDVLSSNLDWLSLRILSSSHDYDLDIGTGNELTFTFNDINLPPESEDEAGSQGYIAFQVRTNDDLQLGDTIENYADIYFDFNPAIVTNTVTTTVVEFVDLEAPIASCQSLQATLDADGNVILDAMAIGENSTDNVDISTIEVVPASFSCDDIGMNEVTVTVTDTSGNQSTCMAMIEVVDDLAPEIMCSEDLEVGVIQGEEYIVPNYFSEGLVTATDNCSDTVTFISQTPAPDFGVPGGNHDVTITLADDLGNESICTFNLFVDDILGIGQNQLLDSVSIFPNPTSQILNIETDTSITLLNANIRSVLGETIITSQDNVIDVSNVSSGIYFIEIITDKGTLLKKIVKN